MKNKNQNESRPIGRVPQLRFPEFRDRPEWGEKCLSMVVKLIEKRAGKNIYTLMSVTAGIGLVSQIEKFGREIAGSQYKNYYVIKKWDFAYNKSATKQYPEGYISMLEDQDEAALPNSIFTCFRIVDTNTCPQFLNHIFHANYHGIWLRKFIAVGARAHGSLNVDTDDLFRMPIKFPSFAEQQKIADCLSSVDELITLQTLKLDKLKAHQKGLMQQLFPEEGETVPNLRFPEFRDAPEWKEESIGIIAKVTTGNKDTQNKVANGTYPFFVRSQNVERIDSFSFDGEAILTSGDGVGVGKNYHYINGKFDFHQRVYCLHSFRKGINGKFVFHYFSKNFYQRVMQLSAKNSVDSIRRTMITDMPIAIPAYQEQKRIADCLSLIDECISAQTQKVDALKAHKKGLMQLLFPPVEEVNG